MSRRFPRIRARLTATVTLEGSEAVLVCRTRDISQRGCFLDTAQLLEPGARLVVAVMDAARGIAMEVDGRVARCLPPDADGVGRGVGVRFEQPPAEWDEMVAAYQQQQQQGHDPRRKRLRVLVVGDRARQRAAMALYVTSGWDVRFATDLASAQDALSGVQLNAVIAESDLSDIRWQDIMTTARRIQPGARRIVRSSMSHAAPKAIMDTAPDMAPAPPANATPDPAQPLYHQVVNRDAGLDVLLDALLGA